MPTDIDRVYETSTSTGTGAIALNGAVTGFRNFADTVGVGNAVTYCIEAVDANGVPSGQWEITDGTLTGSSQLSRGTLRSSSTGARVNFAAGTKRVFATLPSTQAQDLSYTHTQAVPSATWTITHNLGKYPAVVVLTSAKDLAFGSINYINENSLTITFTSAFGGTAHCN